ncbi:MAG: hypothetical protein M1475_00485 [Actinobacteria bacterium]|nr:hypothetical protein [Actinomycetota bacterium]
MNTKNLVLNCIRHRDNPKIPLMFRAVPAVNEKLINHFKLKDLENDWEKMIEILGADIFSDGETLGAFTTYIPKYAGPSFEAIYEPNHFFIWGIKPEYIYLGSGKEIIFHKNPPLAKIETPDELRKYKFPETGWFDFGTYKRVVTAKKESFEEQKEINPQFLKRSDIYFINTFCFNSIFMTSIFMRGFENMLMDLLSNRFFAKTLIDKIGEFYLDFTIKNLDAIGDRLDLYGIWDDFATQDGLMISAEVWRSYYKPWFVRIIEEIKKYDVMISFHICGNCSEIIPDLIDMGVDILDPVQTSAREMDLEGLNENFGKYICFHGGIDAQKLLAKSNPAVIRNEVSRIKKLFKKNTGIILGPSHYLTNDIPLENILAVYK